MRNVSYKSSSENQNIHLMFNNLLSFFPFLFCLKILPFMRYSEKYSRVGQAVGESMISRRKYAIFMLGN